MLPISFSLSMVCRSVTSTCQLTSLCGAPDVPGVPGGVPEYKTFEVTILGGGAFKASKALKLGEAEMELLRMLAVLAGSVGLLRCDDDRNEK